MIRKTEQPGYVLVLSLMIIALVVAIVTSLADRGGVHARYLQLVINREKAKILAWSGVQIAMSQLAHAGDLPEPKEGATPEKKDKEGAKQDSNGQAKQTVVTLLPILNNWQTFRLKKKNDGVKGQIKVCISSEEGKINLNHVFDFKKKKFLNEGAKTLRQAQGRRQIDYKKYFQELFKTIGNIAGMGNLFGPFEKFLKARQTKLQDVTELLTIKEFESFRDNIFYQPDDAQVTDETGKLKQTIYLQDIFTLWSFQKELDPWFLSHSHKVLFGLKEKKQEGKFPDEKKLQEKLKNFSTNMEFPKGWDQLLAPIYGKKFDVLPKEMRAALGGKFEPRLFSVLSYGTVGGVTQKMLVILKRVQTTSKDSTGKSVTSFEFSAKKFYWL